MGIWRLRCATIVWSSFLHVFHFQDQALANLAEWLADPAIASNPTLLLVTGVIYAHEQNYNEALKHTHVGGTLDLWVNILDVERNPCQFQCLDMLLEFWQCLWQIFLCWRCNLALLSCISDHGSFWLSLTAKSCSWMVAEVHWMCRFTWRCIVQIMQRSNWKSCNRLMRTTHSLSLPMLGWILLW